MPDGNLIAAPEVLTGEVLSGIPVDFRPHPITTEGRTFVTAPAGTTLEEAFRDKLAPGAPAVATVNGAVVARSEWGSVVLQESDVVNVRATVAGGGGGGGSNPIAIVLTIAVLIAAPYAASTLALGLFEIGAIASIGGVIAATPLITAAIGLGGILIVNSLFPPRLPKPPTQRGASGAPVPQYSLSGGSNRARPFEPLLLLLGTHRMFPDVVAREYTEFEEDSNDQILFSTFDFGIGNLGGALPTDEINVGETGLDNYPEVETQQNVASVTLVYGNVDTIQGGVLEEDSPTIMRTTAGKTSAVAFDIVVQHFLVNDGGNILGQETDFRIEWRENGTTGPWLQRDITIRTPNGSESRNPTRRSFKVLLGREAAWDLRTTLVSTPDISNTKRTFNASAPAFRAFQEDAANFTGRNPLAMRIKATGQLQGRLDSVNAVRSQMIDKWNGSRWVPNQISGNCGDVLLKFLRGWYISGQLVAGLGVPDSRINLESIQGFAEHCTANGLECNMVLDSGRDRAEVLRIICQCGWGAINQESGKIGVLWEDAGRPMTALITPANVIANTLAVSYDHENLADEVVGNFIDRMSDYQTNQIRRLVPDPAISTPTRPVEVELEGIVDGDHAAKELNRMVAAQFYHTRSITWEMDIGEAMAISRGDVVGAAHGLIGAGVGGSLVWISGDRSRVRMMRDDIEPSGTIWIWDLNSAVLMRTYTYADGVITLNSPLPAPPPNVTDDPLAYRATAFRNSADLVKLRVTGKEPAGQSRIRFTARDEVDAYYAHRTADLTWNPLGTSIASHLVGVGGFVVTQNSYGARVFGWTPHPNPSVVGYQIRYAEADSAQAASWNTMTPLHHGNLTASPYEVLDRPDAGTWRFAICAFLANGRRTVPTFARAILSPPGQQINEATWLFGNGDPSDSLGEDGNLYLDRDTIVIWKKENGVWTKIADLSGADGATWHTGAGAPVNTLGSDGDFYFRVGTGALAGTIYMKVSGSWVKQVDIDQGSDGATWHSGSGLPDNDLGKVGDWFFRTDQGYVYEKTGEAEWTFQRDLTGPQGINGATWHTGNGIPASGLGDNGDFYFQHDESDVWQKAAGVWTKIADLSGADGANWFTGNGAPAGTLGAVGDWYFRTSNAGIYRKTAADSWTFLLDIDGADGEPGADGAIWHSGSGVPSSSLGKVGDWYFRSSNGFVYEKTGASTWTFRRDITGPQGPTGPQGERGLPGSTVTGYLDQVNIVIAGVASPPGSSGPFWQVRHVENVRARVVSSSAAGARRGQLAFDRRPWAAYSGSTSGGGNPDRFGRDVLVGNLTTADWPS